MLSDSSISSLGVAIELAIEDVVESPPLGTVEADITATGLTYLGSSSVRAVLSDSSMMGCGMNFDFSKFFTISFSFTQISSLNMP